MLKYTVPLLLILTFSPVYIWLGKRFYDPSDMFFGWIPVLFLLIVFISNEIKKGKKSEKEPPSQGLLILISILLSLYSLSYFTHFPMIRAILAFTTLSTYMSFRIEKKLFNFSTWGLFMLSLPIMATMQFYLGYPMRYFVATIASAVLNICGYAVTVVGVTLHWESYIISVDAPCSGLKMVYSGALTVCILCFINKFNHFKILLFSMIAFIIIVMSNIARILALFLVEAEVLKLNPDSVHTPIGLICYTSAIISLLFICEIIKRGKKCLKP